MRSKGTVVAAMSGGVDSAVAAALLKRDGYDVIGVTLQIWQEHAEQGKYGGCCSLGAVEDARRAAAHIGIPHYVLNFREFFAAQVIDRFVAEYARGRTPNPCVECNRSVKFEELLSQAEQLNADFLATGHYARIRYNESSGRQELLRSVNTDKDQSYALYTLSQRALGKSLFPLGELAGGKVEARELARQFGLLLANKADSQEICFVPRSGYVDFLKERAPSTSAAGEVVTESGQVIGHHEGIAFYTIGQRKRLPSGSSEALFVVELRPDENRVVVGPERALYADALTADDLLYCAVSALPDNGNTIAARARIRYNGDSSPARVSLSSGSGEMMVRFETPQRAVTPGQACVCYGGEAGEVVLCGGTIRQAVRRAVSV